MEKFALSLTQAQQYVQTARYSFTQDTRYLSRCIDGRYMSSPELPPLAMAGGDAGELAVLLAASNIYGFELNPDKCMRILTEIVGGEKRLGYHTDSHANGAVGCVGCGHMKQIHKDPAAYNLTDELVKTLDGLILGSLKKGAKEVCLEGDHRESAVFLVNGPFSLLPQATIQSDGDALPVSIFMAHKSLTDARHVELAERLVAEGIVKLEAGLGQEYFYESISEVTDDHLLETAKRLAQGLPIYSVQFKEDGSFTIDDMGMVGA